VAGRALLHELGEAAGRVRIEPVLGQLGEHLVAQGAAAPERDDLALVLGNDGRVHLVLRLRARVEDAQVLGAVAGQLGVRRHRLRPRAALADDHLAVANQDGSDGDLPLRRRALCEIQGALHPAGVP